MRGLFKRKGSNVWQGRFRIAEHLWQKRDDLRILMVPGVGNSQEFARSLHTDQKDKAEVTYRAMLTQWDSQMAAWDLVLQNGLTTLTPRQALSTATLGAAARFEKYRDNPAVAPRPPTVPATPVGLSQTEHLILASLSPEESQAALQELKLLGLGLQSDDPLEQDKWHNALVNGEGRLWAFPMLRAKLLLAAEAKAGANSDAAMEAAGVKSIDLHSRHMLNMNTMAKEGAYRDALAWSLSNLGDPPLVEEAKLALASVPGSSKPPLNTLSLFDLLDHKAKVQTIKAKTVSVDRSYLTKFANFLSHSDALKVTKEDVRKWRDSLIKAGNLSTKTINDKYLSALRAVLSHGVKEFDLPVNVSSGIRDTREVTRKLESKGYSDEQAQTILQATFSGTTKALSAPHKRAVFWVPWILAYTGLRVSEVTQLQGRNLKFQGDIPYLVISPEDGSTKSNSEWTVGIHDHLIELGLIDMLRRIGDGPAFYSPYPKGTNFKKIGTHRAKYSGTRIADWVTNEVGIAAPLGKPSHAWRHQITTRTRDVEIDPAARDYMMGERAKSARESYGDWPPAVLSREINKIPKYTVTDTGFRPE